VQNLCVLTGRNAYAVREEKERWIRTFRGKYGDENLSRVDGGATTVRALQDEVSAAPFIAAKRLVIVEGFPDMTKEDVTLLTRALHPDAVLLIVDAHPDRRLAAVKELLNRATVKEFHPIAGRELVRWMDRRLAEAGGSIDAPARALLLERVGEDQELLAGELAKLVLFASGRVIGVSDVDVLVSERSEQAWWHLTELIAAGRTREALTYCRGMMERGESPHALWNTLLWIVASLAETAAAVADGKTSVERIAAGTGMKPGTVRTLLPLARTMDPAKVRALVGRFVRADRELKTGGYRATGSETQEIAALVDEGILAFSL